jgi:hypothetical protein
VTDSRVRPRYGRLAAASLALAVTLVTLLGAVGILPTSSSAAASAGAQGGLQATLATWPIDVPSPGETGATTTTGVPLPVDSGTGKRVVFDISDQRVWLVDGTEEVLSSYLVSGSLTDNLNAGTYAVYSRSRWAVGIDDSGAMQYFTRFTRGANAAIGFHSIPTKDGHLVQTRAQLGTPQSHGCIRQALPDAKRLWDFAPVGTKVVVTA